MNHSPLIPVLGGALAASAVWIPLLIGAGVKLRKANQAAARDPQTGLAHRNTARSVYRQRTAVGRLSTLLLIDLDRFKPINDALGHHAGDQIIDAIASRLTQFADERDGLAARLGGDEFVILTDAADPAVHARQLSDLREIISHPIQVQGHHAAITLSVTATVGIAVGDGPLALVSWEILLRAADLALYHAKRSQFAYQFHRPDLLVPDLDSDLRVRDLHSEGGEPQ